MNMLPAQVSIRDELRGASERAAALRQAREAPEAVEVALDVSTGSDGEVAAQAAKLKISKSEIKEMKEVFDLIDANGSGEISFDEMKDLMKLVGMDSDPQRGRGVVLGLAGGRGDAVARRLFGPRRGSRRRRGAAAPVPRRRRGARRRR